MNRGALTYSYRISGAVALLLWVVLAVLSQKGPLAVPTLILLTVGAGIAVMAALYSKLRLMHMPRIKIWGLISILAIGFSVSAISILLNR